MIINRIIQASILFCISNVFSQTNLVNNDINVVVNANTFIHVAGNVKIDGSTSIENNGSIRVSNNWNNNNLLPNVFITPQGLVDFFGVNQQVLGSTASDFHNLLFSGNGTKELLNDIEVKNNLSLVDSRLQTNEFVAYVSNPLVNAITWNSGFVSTNELQGSLRRSTNTTSDYSFPLGSNTLTGVYRPVIITPSTPTPEIYTTNLASYSPDLAQGLSPANFNSPFYIDNKESIIKNINTNFYHTISNQSGLADQALVKLPYFLSDETNSFKFANVAQYQSTGSDFEWRNINATPVTPNLPNFNNPEKMKSFILAGSSTDAYAFTGKAIRVSEFISPNGNGENEVFFIDGLDQYDYNKILIFDRWGNGVYTKENYQNDWQGTNEVSKVLPFGSVLDSDTYFYILYLDKEPPLSGYFELLK